MVFYGPSGSIEEIYIKEWDGEKVTKEGVRLNLSRFLMILHNAEIIDHTIDKILKGAQDQDTKIHIGASYYPSPNSPYKTVAIRVWKKGGTGELFPTKIVSQLINGGNFARFLINYTQRGWRFSLSYLALYNQKKMVTIN